MFLCVLALKILILFIRINPETNQVEMTFRTAPIVLTLDDFQEGKKVDGVVRKKEPYGVFIQIKNTKISGLCHKSEVRLP